MQFLQNFVGMIMYISNTISEWSHFLMYKWFKRNNIQRDEEDITGKCIVLTGGSSGLGKASAAEFARRGAIVVIGDVDLENGETAVREIRKETGNMNVKILKLDLSDMDSVEQFANEVSADHPKIKILFNNAAIGGSKSENIITKDGFNIHMAVNYMGHFLLTNLLMDNLKAETNSRIVTTSSHLMLLQKLDIDDLNMEKSAGFGFKNVLPYCNSKFCLALFTKEMGSRGMNAYALCPGTMITPILDALPKGMHLMTPLWRPFTSTPNEAASEFVMYCAIEKSIACEIGKMFRFRSYFHKANESLDSDLARKLWDESTTLVRLNERLARQSNISKSK